MCLWLYMFGVNINNDIFNICFRYAKSDTYVLTKSLLDEASRDNLEAILVLKSRITPVGVSNRFFTMHG